MKRISDKALASIEKVAETVFAQFINSGGVLRSGDEVLPADQVAARNGCLPALMYLFNEFSVEISLPADYGTPQNLIFGRDHKAYGGYQLEGFDIAPKCTEAMAVLLVTDFLRFEVVPEMCMEVDFSDLMLKFRAHCDEHVPAEPALVAELQPD